MPSDHIRAPGAPAARAAQRPLAVAIASALVCLAALILLLGGGGDDIVEPVAGPGPGNGGSRPNVVVVMTDDQALDTMQAMRRTRRHLGEHGTTFSRAFVTFPLCCPSRATFLTGQYAHNHGVRNNSGPNGGYQALDASRTLPVWLSRAGYRTGFVGKFLNGYGDGEHGAREVPPGWHEWYGLPADAKQAAFDFDLNENGRLVHYGDGNGAGPYKTRVLGQKAEHFVEGAAKGRRPFFLWLATNGPHRDGGLPDDAERNPVPAPRDHGAFESARLPRDRAIDEADVSDKPKAVRGEPRLDRGTRERLDREYVSQLESLLAIDRVVARLTRRLRDAGELDNTLFVFTSDNGFIRGQHRLEGKSRPYEEAIRVPLLIRGPGFDAGVRDSRLVANVDLAATILDATGAAPDLTVDGRSLLASEEWQRAARDAVLIEVFERKQSFTGLRTQRYTYAEYESGDRELYDLRRDPDQLENLAERPRAREVRELLAARLAALRQCQGPAECG